MREWLILCLGAGPEAISEERAQLFVDKVFLPHYDTLLNALLLHQDDTSTDDSPIESNTPGKIYAVRRLLEYGANNKAKLKEMQKKKCLDDLVTRAVHGRQEPIAIADAVVEVVEQDFAIRRMKTRSSRVSEKV